MSTALGYNSGKLPKLKKLKIGIAVAEWNKKITDALLMGAIDKFKEEGYADDCVDVFHVPGTIELTYAASRMVKSGKYDAVIIFGCVIRGDTAHFDYVCQSVTEGMTHLNATTDTPVIFGVLTTDNEQQAIDRAGGILGNKGTEAAECAIKMYRFKIEVQPSPPSLERSGKGGGGRQATQRVIQQYKK